MRRNQRAVAVAGRLLAAGIVLAIALAGCGGSSDHGRSTALRSLQRKFAEQNRALHDPPLITCGNMQLRSLPTSRLVALDAPKAAGELTGQLRTITAACVGGGHGDGPVRALVGTQLTRSIAARARSLPSAYTSCVDHAAGGLADADLAAIVSASGSSATASAQAAQVGRRLGLACVKTPAVASVVSAQYVTPIERELTRHGYSSAFRACVVKQARAIRASTLTAIATQLIGDPAAGKRRASSLGQTWSKQCIESGATP